MQNYLNEKLLNLSDISILLHYNKINSSYYELRNYIKKSKGKIYNYLNLCANITYEEFNKEFDKIVNNTESFNIDISENSKSKTLKHYEKKSDPANIINRSRPNKININIINSF